MSQTKKRQIIFVDDEPMILEGLRRSLHKMRDQWDIDFAGSGHEALQMMSKKSYDAVISDLNMPVMNGLQLLKKVRNYYPGAARMILTGQISDELNLVNLLDVHQVLEKPWNREQIQNSLNRIFRLNELFSKSSMQNIIANIHSIPAIPALYHELLLAIESNMSLSEMGQIVAKDMAMSAKILQIVNSAFFGLPRQITDPVNAVVYLGINLVKSLLLSLQVYSHYDQPGFQETIDCLWRHSMTTGANIKLLSDLNGANEEERNELFVMGLLHDIGKLILIDNFPDETTMVKELAVSEKISCLEAEEEIFGTNHAKIGAYLLGLWGLPD
jgi:HD-like signal output (HDOD) protein/CheY-like chemotaxis protein